MSSIEWTGVTWNMIAGCSLASPGCARCYAGTMARRQVAMAAATGRASPYDGVVRIAEPGQKARTGAAAWNGVVRFLPERLGVPLRWRAPRTVFVCSMADLFHEAMNFDDIASVFGVMAATPQHTYQVLTKRPERLIAWLTAAPLLPGEDTAMSVARAAAHHGGIVWDGRGSQRHLYASLPVNLDKRRPWRWPLANVWLGVSVEDQQRADERLPLLAQVRAAGWHTFTSVEPLIGPIKADWSASEWVIIGGESGPHSRRCDAGWIRRVRDDARAAGAAVFVKQLGAAYEDATHGVMGAATRLGEAARDALPATPRRLTNRKGNDPAEWPEDLRVREWPAGMRRPGGA